MNIPKNLKYTAEHEWVKIDGDIATVGITEFAQSELGDIVFVEVDTVGDELDQNDVFGTIEAVKTVSDLFSPVAGEILEFNTELEDAPENINQDSYDKGWIVKIKMSDPSQANALLDAEGYEKIIS